MSEIDVARWLAAEMDYHDSNAHIIHAEVKQGDLRYDAPKRLFFLPYLRFPGERCIVDIACGTANSVATLLGSRRDCIHYIGVDISREMLMIARSNMTNGQFVQASGHKLPLEKGVADYVFSWGALHHMPDVVVALDAIINLLKPGGLLFLLEPTPRVGTGWEDSPRERGVRITTIRSVIQCSSCEFISIHYINSRFTALVRRMLRKLKMSRVEHYGATRYLLTYLDLAADRVCGSLFSFFQGRDVIAVVRKAASSE